MALLSVPTMLLGSQPAAVEVLQPIDIENVIRLSRVTYTGYYQDGAGGAISAVLMTCDRNIVPTYADPQNLNVAADAGLKIRVEFNSGHEPPLFGDTLRVVLDATPLDTLNKSISWPDTTIMSATVQCILVNAAQFPAIKRVDLKVEGKSLYRTYAGVFSTRRFRCGPIRRDFW